MNTEEIIAKQNELRNKRNEYTNKAQKCQEEIDKLELERYNVNELIGKYIKIIDSKEKVKYAMHIESVERLFRGPRFYGSFISLDDEEFRYINHIDFDKFKWENYAFNIIPITKKEFHSLLFESWSFFLKSEDELTDKIETKQLLNAFQEIDG